MPEREEQLWRVLDREPYLVVLDGLERLLVAYARMDAAHMADDDLDAQTANRVAGALGLPESAAQSFVGQHALRKSADPRVGAFLRRLTLINQSRVLITTRLYPTELQMITGWPLFGCYALFLNGLSDDDALNLWRGMGVSGSRDQLLPMFHRFENYPLLIRALAGEVSKSHRAAGDFDQWRKANPGFDPLQDLSPVMVKSHVLYYAMLDLDSKARRVLEVLAAFRMPAHYDTLAALLIDSGSPIPPTSFSHSAEKGGANAANSPSLRSGEGAGGEVSFKLFSSERELDTALTDLEDRGLIGWDKPHNRYDLHPVVRGTAWNSLPADSRREVYGALSQHFESVPQIEDWQQVERYEDLTPAIELYHALIGVGHYDEAGRLFYDRIYKATLYRLSAARQNIELLERLFPDGLDHLPRRSRPDGQGFVLESLAHAYNNSGQPGRAAPVYLRSAGIDEERGHKEGMSTSLRNLSNALRLSGSLRGAKAAACRALLLTRETQNRFQEAISLQWLGLALAARAGNEAQHAQAEAALRRSLRLFIEDNNKQGEGTATAFLAQAALWAGDPAAAQPHAARAWEVAHVYRLEADFILAARLQGAAALILGDLVTGDERLHHAVTRARAVNFVEEELPALVGLAELARQRGHPDEARERLDEIWELAERGPYPLWHADALNVLAQIERDAGNRDAAIKAATEAYRKAWCDGEPFAYAYGLRHARAHLAALGAPEPHLPPFDPSQHEPMPEVEIDPPDDRGA